MFDSILVDLTRARTGRCKHSGNNCLENNNMSWNVACAVADVDEGSVVEFEVDGFEILVSNVAGEFRAYPPMCPHMEEPLGDSAICKGQVMTCHIGDGTIFILEGEHPRMLSPPEGKGSRTHFVTTKGALPRMWKRAGRIERG